MDWYHGPALLELLEQVEVAYDHPHETPDALPGAVGDPPVQRDRGAGGPPRLRRSARERSAASAGDEVMVLPAGERTRIVEIG